MRPSVYLAGPEVFHPAAAAIFERRKNACLQRDLEPLIPFDGTDGSAEDIYRFNLALLGRADGVIANVSPFRGPHCDVGTAFEIGYAAKRGIPIWGFSDSSELLSARVAQEGGADLRGHLLEQFDLAENLMIVEALEGQRFMASFEEALAEAASGLRRPRAPDAGPTRARRFGNC